MNTETLLLILLPPAALIATLLLAVASDVRSRRIPNRLVLACAALGLLCQVGVFFSGEFFMNYFGASSLGSALLGGLSGLGLFLPLYALGLLGAGDVKLLAAIGLWLGTEHLLYAALWTLFAGGALAVAWSAGTGTLRQVLSNVRDMLLGSYMSVSGGGGVSIAATRASARLPYAVAIACGTAFEIVRPYF
jgi:prepilin peptidase CpaA